MDGWEGTRYEYRREVIPANPRDQQTLAEFQAETIERLNDWGNEGWMLTCAFVSDNKQWVAIFLMRVVR